MARSAGENGMVQARVRVHNCERRDGRLIGPAPSSVAQRSEAPFAPVNGCGEGSRGAGARRAACSGRWALYALPVPHSGEVLHLALLCGAVPQRERCQIGMPARSAQTLARRGGAAQGGAAWALPLRISPGLPSARPRSGGSMTLLRSVPERRVGRGPSRSLSVRGVGGRCRCRVQA
jgi:hypothetical protein